MVFGVCFKFADGLCRSTRFCCSVSPLLHAMPPRSAPHKSTPKPCKSTPKPRIGVVLRNIKVENGKVTLERRSRPKKSDKQPFIPVHASSKDTATAKQTESQFYYEADQAVEDLFNAPEEGWDAKTPQNPEENGGSTVSCALILCVYATS